MSIKTLIDYVFVPDSAELDVVYATIVDSIPYSVSDHYPIKVSLKIRHATHISRTPHSSAVLKWKEASFDDKWLYKYESESSLRTLPLDYNDTADVHTHIDEYIGVIIDSLKAAAIASIPVSNYRPYLKPYWTTSNLKENHTDMRSARRAWINNGRPRGLQDESYRRYKDFKRRQLTHITMVHLPQKGECQHDTCEIHYKMKKEQMEKQSNVWEDSSA